MHNIRLIETRNVPDLTMGVTLKLPTLTNVAFRSLFLEASWNHGGQQNLGLAAAIDPALRKIYGESGEDLKKARERALEFFNTNPISSGVVIGVIIKLEQDVAAGRLNPTDRLRMAGSLSQTLASMGDSLFWQAWLPLCCLVAVWAVLSTHYWWTPLLLPLLFCLPAVPARFIGLYFGYRRGIDVIDLLFRLKIQRLAQNIRKGVALLVGASTVILVSTQTALAEDLSLLPLWLTMAGVAATVMAFRLLSLKIKQLGYWYPVIIVALACSVMIILDRWL